MATKPDVQKPTSQEWFRNSIGFRETSGVKITDGDLQGEYTDYSLVTDEKQGIAW